MKIKLPIFWHTDDTRKIEELGLQEPETTDEKEFEDYDKREVIFYSMVAITKYNNKDLHTRLYVNGDTFICCLPFKEVEKIIDNAYL